MSKAAEKLKALQEELGITPGQGAPQIDARPQQEDQECLDTAPWTARTDTPAAARYRSGRDSVRLVRHAEESKYYFGEAGIAQLAHDLLRAHKEEAKLTIDVLVTENTLDER